MFRAVLLHYLAIIGLMIAIYNPKIEAPRDSHGYMFVIDITQSMNVEDMRIDGIQVSRLNYTLALLGATLKELPCGSSVSVALFANAEIVPLYTPLEVCSNYNELYETLNHIEWRMAWRGSSHLRLGLQDASRVLLTFPEPAQIVFLTDGDEAAPINAITKIELTPMPGSNGWLLAGIGSSNLSPVPKFNSKNQIIGFWSAYATKIEPSQIVNEESEGKRDDSIASEPREYYLSALREEYLKEMSYDIGANYIRADNQLAFIKKVKELPPSSHDLHPIGIGWLFALASALCVLIETTRIGNFYNKETSF